MSMATNLDRIFESEFADYQVATPAGAQTEVAQCEVAPASTWAPCLSPRVPPASTEVGEGEEGQRCGRLARARRSCARIVGHRAWQASFLALTLFVLFSADFDSAWGTEETKFILSIVTSVFFVAFFVELVVQSFGRPGFFGRWYFWLDLVALASLLPDTWFLQALPSSSQFVAARSSKVARMIRVATRSMRTARLNRLLKIVRVAALMPRMTAAFSKRREAEVRDFMDKKLCILFRLLDEDHDDRISREQVAAVMRGSSDDEGPGDARGEPGPGGG